MAPLKPIQSDRDASDKRAQAVLVFAQKTHDLLRNRNAIHSSLPEDLSSIIKRSFPLQSTKALTGNAFEFDSLGCELWNAATRIIRDGEHKRDPRVQHDDHTYLVALLRVFAYLLIDTAHPSAPKRSKDAERQTRNFKIALKACRFCLDKGELELGQIVLERCSDYVSAVEDRSPLVRISNDSQEDDERQAALQTMVAEFYLLRMTHAWKTKRFDLAEHHYNRVSLTQFSESATLAEKAADLFYEAGKFLSKNKLEDTAIIWLGRAISALDACTPEQQSQDAGELRLTVSSCLVECLLRINDQDSVKRARGLVEELASLHGFGNRMAIHLMNFNLVLAEQPVHHGRLTESISRVMGSVVLTDRTFKIIMQTIHRARRVSAETACDAIRRFITERLLKDLTGDGELGSSNIDYMEKACVTYTLFASTELRESRSALDALRNTLDTLAQRSNNAMSPKATHAAQTLMWKAVGASNPESADIWCSLLRHPLFEAAGHINKARICRKAMTMAMDKYELEAAREAFFQMPIAVQNESLTRYLAFKLALRTNDYDLADESLNVIFRQASNEQTFLYACVLEAQQSEMRTVAVAALQAILDKKPTTAHLPSLLRCTARLLIGELSKSDRSIEQVMKEVVQSFENAAENIQAFKKASDDQWRAEVQWWSKNAYNLSLQWCEQMQPEHLVRLLAVCIKFIDAYPSDAGIMHQDDLKRRKALCHFLSASALIALSRSAEEGSEYSLQCYLQARQDIKAFKLLVANTPDGSWSDFKTKSFELLKFDLECILHLQHWNQLNEALQACLDFKHVDRWDTLADIVLIIRQHADTKSREDANANMDRVLERIINDTWQKEKDITKASRWLRLSFTMDLSDSCGEFALKLLKQAINMSRKAYNRQNATYPETELQWLATTAFNKAIDLLSSGLADGSKEWMEGALELARYGADNGALHANLMDRKTLVMQRVREMERL